MIRFLKFSLFIGMGIYSDFLSYFEILSSSPQKCGTKSYSVSDLWLFS